MTRQSGQLYEFGPFRFDPEDRSLHCGNRPVKLRRRAGDVLLALLEDNGRIVSHDQLVEQAWAGAAISDGAVSFQIHSIRQTLKQAGGTQEYIENVPGLGYRFVAPVRMARADGAVDSGAVEAAVETSSMEPTTATRTKRSAPYMWATVCLGIVGLGLAIFTGFGGTSRPPRVLDYAPITRDGRPKSISTPLLLGDGQIYYRESFGFTFKAVTTKGGEPPSLFGEPSEFVLADVRPTGGEYLMLKGSQTASNGEGEIWVTRSGVPKRVGDIVGRDAVWSADGQQIVYISGKELWVVRSDGTGRRTLSTPSPGSLTVPRWSPRGDVIRFTLVTPYDQPRETSLWEVRADGTNLHRLLEGWSHPSAECCGNWSPNGDYFVFESARDGTSSLWALPERRGMFQGPMTPVPLTSGPLSWTSPVVSQDGRTIFAIGIQNSVELVKYSPELREFVPYLPGVSGTWITYSPDGKWIAYVGYPDKKLWRARPDVSDKQQLTFGPFDLDGATWSPDGKWIAFRSRLGGTRLKIYLVPAEGGKPYPIVPGDIEQGLPTWSPEGTRLAYGDVPGATGPATGDEVLHIYNVATRDFLVVPGSREQRVWTARWSPDRRYLSALTIEGHKLRLYEFSTGRWHSLAADHIEDPAWSPDGAFIYYHSDDSTYVLRRVHIPDGHVETLVDMRDYPLLPAAWNGVSPDNMAVVARNYGATEVYALRLDVRGQ